MTMIPNDKLWRSPEHFAATPEFTESARPEFPPDIESVEMDGLSRRKFLGVMSASMALAGLTTTGCWRKPYEYILPYSERPESVIPGNATFYRTAVVSGSSVLGLQVETHEGRPTKVEGNPDHPMSNPRGVLRMGGRPYGATNTFAQGLLLHLYDPDRSQTPRREGLDASWADFWRFARNHMESVASASGRGLAVLVEDEYSPTFARVLRELTRSFPQARVFRHNAVSTAAREAGATMVGAENRRILYDLGRATRVLTLDADIFGTAHDSVRNSALFFEQRRVEGVEDVAVGGDRFPRLYVVEPVQTVTGVAADNRLRLSAAQIGPFTRALAAVIGSGTGLAEGIRGRIAADVEDESLRRWVDEIANDLLAHRSQSVVVVGDSQPAWVHALGHLINAQLEAPQNTVEYFEDSDFVNAGTIEDLAAGLRSGAVTTLIALGANPALTAPADLDFSTLLAADGVTTIHSGLYRDETANLATWHLPASHAFEAWGDRRGTDGTVAIQQPLIAPLYGTQSELAVLGRLVNLGTGAAFRAEVEATAADGDLGHELVRGTWRQAHPSPTFERHWRRWLHDGTLGEVGANRQRTPQWSWQAVADALPEGRSTAAMAPQMQFGIELNFRADYSVFDGRFANNGWLQETPDPVTKLTWDNAALVSPATAAALQVENGDMVRITVGGRSLEIPIWISPGNADAVVALPLGYGRSVGSVSTGAGFDVYGLRTIETVGFARGASVERAGGTYLLASTQNHNLLIPRPGFPERPLIRRATIDEYREHPHFVEDYEAYENPTSMLFQPSVVQEGQQWAMSINLDACTGCSACVVACTAENNVPVVGKERVDNGREMHWLRIDRYYAGDDPMGNPEMLVQPLPCQHCENAPCETVCPVAATAHSPEGLNDMAYNRCIGTRYCSNNCPYKVRRFNFFNYTRENHEAAPELEMVRNPNVTMRFRGVMEKCSFCVQRINARKIANHREGQSTVPDGEIMPACAQACPTRAIVFGDKNLEGSEVGRLRHNERNYAILAELNNHPRTTYMAKLRNPNPNLVA